MISSCNPCAQAGAIFHLFWKYKHSALGTSEYYNSFLPNFFFPPSKSWLLCLSLLLRIFYPFFISMKTTPKSWLAVNKLWDSCIIIQPQLSLFGIHIPQHLLIQRPKKRIAFVQQWSKTNLQQRFSVEHISRKTAKQIIVAAWKLLVTYLLHSTSDESKLEHMAATIGTYVLLTLPTCYLGSLAFWKKSRFSI